MVSAATADPRLLKAYPNPANHGVLLEWDPGGHRPAVLSVHNLLGHVVWQHVDPSNHSGPQRVVWSGQTQAGQPAASGEYIATLQCGGRRDFLRVVLVR